MYRSTYRSSIGRYVDRYISVKGRSIYRPRCVGRHIDRCISAEWWSIHRPRYLPIVGRYSGRHSADTLTIDCRRSIGRLSVVYRSSVSYNISQKLRLSVTGVNKAVAKLAEGKWGQLPSPPQNKIYILEQKFLFLKYRAENLKFAEITLLSLRQQNAFVGNEYAVQDN